MALRRSDRGAVTSPYAVRIGRRPDLGQHGPRNVEESEQLVVPLERFEVHQHGAAGVGDVGDVRAAVDAAGELPDQPAVDRTEDGVAGFGVGPDAVDVVEDPLDLAAGEVRRRRQARTAAGSARRDRRAPAGWRSGRCGCPARRSRCSTGRPVRRFHTTVVSRWLVMPMAARSRRREARVRAARRAITALVRPQISTGSCSTQAGPRHDLLVLELAAADLVAVVIEDHEPRARRPLVHSTHEVGHDPVWPLPRAPRTARCSRCDGGGAQT